MRSGISLIGATAGGTASDVGGSCGVRFGLCGL